MIIEPAGPSALVAALADFMPPVGQTVWLWLDQDASHSILLRSTGSLDGTVRRWTEDRWLVEAGQVIRATERTIFELSDAGFGEVARYREDGGPNVHQQAIRIPSEPELDVAYHPFPDPAASLTLTFAGPSSVGRVLSLKAQVADQQRVQWMLEGFGEIWLGPPGEPPFRWAVGGWRDDGQTFGDGVPESLRTGFLPGLAPAGGGDRVKPDPFA